MLVAVRSRLFVSLLRVRLNQLPGGHQRNCSDGKTWPTQLPIGARLPAEPNATNGLQGPGQPIEHKCICHATRSCLSQ